MLGTRRESFKPHRFVVEHVFSRNEQLVCGRIFTLFLDIDYFWGDRPNRGSLRNLLLRFLKNLLFILRRVALFEELVCQLVLEEENF